jgi:hypothetical protein
MDAIDYAEKIASDTLSEARSTYDALHERVHKFVTLALGGAGGLGAYAINIAAPNRLPPALALGAVACWLLLVSGLLLLRGAASSELRAGSTSQALRTRLEQHSSAMDGQDATNEQRAAIALLNTRWDQLSAVDAQISEYAKAGIRRAEALDRAYLAAVIGSPIALLAGYAASYVISRS